MEPTTDKTTKLIRWQRVTIATLLMLVVVIGINHNREHKRAERALGAVTGLVQTNQMEVGQWESLERQRQVERAFDKQVIRDAMERLDRYEARYGPLGPRKGEGVSIGKLGLTEP
ncbi:MAG: hypothetical protein V4671_14915 [Armatimonadota bacterium]